MDSKRILKQLESLGTAQNREVYARHGVTGKAFGVSYANLGKLVNMTYLGLHDNDLEGPIPSSLGELSFSFFGLA